jgi:5'-nucleotidase
MKRSDFLRNTFLITGGSILAPSILANETNLSRSNIKKLTVLHTNDTHSTIDPFPSNHASYAGMGGVSRRYELINAVKETNENVLLLDAGDIFQGTPYFNLFKGVLEMKLMSELGYDAATMGNHDFDIGIDGFLNAKQHAQFPFICSNYLFTNTDLDGRTERYKVLQKGDVRIGIFGIGVELKGLVPADKYGETVYADPIEIATDCVAELQKKNCDLIICLSHLGYSYESNKISDIRLAQETLGIHLIIGGHTHTFLNEPTVLQNKEGKPVLVNQVGWGGIHLGRIDFEIEKVPEKKESFLLN